MIDIAEARRRVAERLHRRFGDIVDDLAINDRATIEQDFGWIFFWDHRKAIETGNRRDRILGNSPVLITRDGEMFSTGTADPIEHYIALFRAGRLEKYPTE